jgi:hypothetical protein
MIVLSISEVLVLIRRALVLWEGLAGASCPSVFSVCGSSDMTNSAGAKERRFQEDIDQSMEVVQLNYGVVDLESSLSEDAFPFSYR